MAEFVSKGAFTRTEVKRILVHNLHRLEDILNDSKSLCDADRHLFEEIMKGIKNYVAF